MPYRVIRNATLLLLLLLCPCLAAQGRSGPAKLPGTMVRKAEVPLLRVRAEPGSVDEGGNVLWDYTVLGRRPAGGTSTSSAAPGGRKALVNCFSSTVSNGFFSVGTTGTEWVSWACKDANKTGLVGAFAIGYATNARGTSDPGGTGATIGVSFFSGTTGFCDRGTRVDVPGDPDDVFDFTGLPGATGSQISPGFFVTAILPTGSVFCLPDGELGWSYVYREPPQGTTQNLTGPILSGLPGNTCWSDAFDLWSSPTAVASCAGVFFFSGCIPPLTFLVPLPCTSFWLQVFEITGVPGSSAAFSDTGGVNPLRYAEVQPANVGDAWLASITLDPVNPAGPEVAGLVRFGLPGTVLPNGIGLAFLVNGSKLLVLGSAANVVATGPGSVQTVDVPVPKDAALIGRTFHTQAFGVLLAPLRLQALNGISLTVGGI